MNTNHNQANILTKNTIAMTIFLKLFQMSVKLAKGPTSVSSIKIINNINVPIIIYYLLKYKWKKLWKTKH